MWSVYFPALVQCDDITHYEKMINNQSSITVLRHPQQEGHRAVPGRGRARPQHLREDGQTLTQGTVEKKKCDGELIVFEKAC